jgi:uncharacterized membrane protein
MILHTKISTFRKEARDSLSGKWVFAAELTLLFFVASMLAQFASAYLFIVPFILAPIFKYGYVLSMLRLSRNEKVTFEMLFDGFSDRFGTYFFAYLVIGVRVFLWSLLLIVPGIIAALAYSQTFFILADKKDITALEAINESKAMMKGNKWRFFLLYLSFIGWEILALFTLFIGYFFLAPYMMMTHAKFYEALKLGRQSHS